jgi:hypothetical protein
MSGRVSHEREAPDSFPSCASLPASCHPDLEIALPCSQSHPPPDPRPRLSLFPSVADKTSFPLPPSRISLQKTALHQIPFPIIQIYFSQRVSPTQSPSSPSRRPVLPSLSRQILFRSPSCKFVPIAGAITPFWVTPPSTRPCRRATCLPHACTPLLLLPYVIVLRH